MSVTLLQLLTAIDGLLRALTPPNLHLFKELMSYLHTVEIYSAAQLGIADIILLVQATAPDQPVAKFSYLNKWYRDSDWNRKICHR